jgi:carbon storage regulator
MLVLSRHRDETIMIGDSIEITVVDIKGDKVRIGINAPREIQVHRKEVYDSIKRENTDASRVQIDDLSVADQNVKKLQRPRPTNGNRLSRNGSRKV